MNYMFLGLEGRNGQENYDTLTRLGDHRLISQGKVFVGWNKRLIEDGHYFYAFSHMPQHALRLPPNTFTITGFRDPVARVLSHYRMILEMKTNNIPHPSLKQEGHWVGGSFTDFLRKMPREHLLNELYMFSKNFNVGEAFENIIKCSFVYFVDTFAEDMRELSQQLNIDLEPIHARKGVLPFQIRPSELLDAQKILEPVIFLIKKLKAYQKKNSNLMLEGLSSG